MFNSSSTLPPRQTLLTFSLRYFLANTFLLLVIIFSYIPLLPAEEGKLFWGFFIVSFIAQMTFLFCVCFVIVNVINLLIPRHFIIIPLCIMLASIFVFALVGDKIAFDVYYMHYASVGIDLIKANALSQVISFSFSEITRLIFICLILFSIESLIAWLILRYLHYQNAHRISLIATVILVGCILISYTIMFLAREWPKKQVFEPMQVDTLIKAARFVPYYDELYQFIMPIGHAHRHIATREGMVNLPAQQSNRPLNYPRHALAYDALTKKFNIVVIVIDTWRYDAMNAQVTPTIYEFSKKALQFQNHWSGGNCTKAGIFSLFYGIPENYWTAMIKQKQGPLLIHQLIQNRYNIGIFASATLHFPDFHQTIFSEVNPPPVSGVGETTIARDQIVTKAFKDFLTKQRPDKPFFSFVFYDAAHNYCDPVTPTHHPFKPWQQICNRFALQASSDATPYVNRYLNAVHFVDNEIKEVLAALKKQGMMKNTIVIFTADHGEEFNDHHSGYWQHASAYTPYQLHTPFLVYWPGMKPQIYRHATTHYDVVPTLMKEVLQCKNPTQDYAIGTSLFSKKARSVLISGSYADYAIIHRQQVFRLYRGGDYVLDDEHGRPLKQVSFDIRPLKQAEKELNAYFK